MQFNQLTWGVKASFRNYVESVGGTVSLSDGARHTEDGAFIFTAIPGGDLSIAEDGSASGTMRFQGKVSFDAHGGMLQSTLSELSIEATPDGLTLSVIDAPTNNSRCSIATLGPAEIAMDGVITLPAQITLDGMYQIADNYPPGTELDPVKLT